MPRADFVCGISFYTLHFPYVEKLTYNHAPSTQFCLRIFEILDLYAPVVGLVHAVKGFPEKVLISMYSSKGSLTQICVLRHQISL
jgi:hypothetical protein